MSGECAVPGSLGVQANAGRKGKGIAYSRNCTPCGGEGVWKHFTAAIRPIVPFYRNIYVFKNLVTFLLLLILLSAKAFAYFFHNYISLLTILV